MLNRRFRLPSPALVISMVALALALGGTAVAARSTIDPDKKADTKLIKALAPTLSVKHAKNATLLSGKTATSLETSAYTYTLPDISGVGVSADLVPGLPPGIYYASFNIAATVGTPGQDVRCSFAMLGTGVHYGLSYGVPYPGTSDVTVSGAGVLDTRTHPVELYCLASAGTFSVDTAQTPPDVTFMPIDHVHAGSATPDPD